MHKKITLGIIISLISFKSFATKTCVAHRCLSRGNDLNLENSLEALHEITKNKSITHIEFDIQHTKDKFPIVYHDSTLKRLVKSKSGFNCPIGKQISDLKLNQIINNCTLINGENIPTLLDFVEVIKINKLHPFIELKDIPSKYTLQLVSSILKRKNFHYISFSYHALVKVKKYYRRIKKSSPSLMYLSSNINDETLKINSEFNALGVNYQSLNNNEYIENFDKILNVWTVNNSFDQLNMLKHPQVKYITSNFPLQCIEFSQM